jgi:hypothetical protein
MIFNDNPKTNYTIAIFFIYFNQLKHHINGNQIIRHYILKITNNIQLITLYTPIDILKSNNV